MIEKMLCIPTADIMLTEKCNMRCKYCFEHKEPRDADFQKTMDYIMKQTNSGYFPFGGEPFMQPKLLGAMLTYMENNQYVSKNKDNILTTMRRIITNGTLIKENLDLIKKHNLTLQISVDGPKEVHDLKRVLADGKSGTFDRIMENVKICKENKINYSFHGVVDKETIEYMFSIFKFFYEQLKYDYNLLLREMSGNIFQIIFEEDFTDKNINDIIDQMNKTAEFIISDETFDIEKRKNILKGYLTRRGGICGLGGNLLSLDTYLNVYPCHRLSSVPNREEFMLGNVYKPDEFKNFKIYNSYQRMSKKVKSMYSVLQNNHNFSNQGVNWFMWCPATNHQTCNNIYYQNPKYNIMHVELNRYINTLFAKYKLEAESIGNSARKQDNC